MHDRLPPLSPDAMSPQQQRAAAALTAGPRGGVRGPFIALLRSPQLMDRLQKVGEYLRYDSMLEARLSEFAMLVHPGYFPATNRSRLRRTHGATGEVYQRPPLLSTSSRST